MRAAWLLLALAGCGSPESRAVDFLRREVPAWEPANRCYSCHNNGDAARALFAARDAGMDVDAPLAATLRFLRRPEAWKDNGVDAEFSDKKLSVLQFAHALAASGERGDSLRAAAAQLRALQQPDGSWAVDAGGLPGSPVTYGRTLATVVARRVLAQAGEPVDPADAWLRARVPAGPLDAGALLMWGRRDDCLDLLRRGQSSYGGWGPTLTSPPEVFDTAIALLGLAAVDGDPGQIRRGRDFLLREQFADGSWPETTRPPGSESYAQRLSTSGWATLALFATRGR